MIFIARGVYSDGSGGYTSLTSWSSADGRGTFPNNNNPGDFVDVKKMILLK